MVYADATAMLIAFITNCRRDSASGAHLIFDKGIDDCGRLPGKNMRCDFIKDAGCNCACPMHSFEGRLVK